MDMTYPSKHDINYIKVVCERHKRGYFIVGGNTYYVEEWDEKEHHPHYHKCPLNSGSGWKNIDHDTVKTKPVRTKKTTRKIKENTTK